MLFEQSFPEYIFRMNKDVLQSKMNLFLIEITPLHFFNNYLNGLEIESTHFGPQIVNNVVVGDLRNQHFDELGISHLVYDVFQQITSVRVDN